MYSEYNGHDTEPCAKHEPFYPSEEIWGEPNLWTTGEIQRNLREWESILLRREFKVVK